MSMNIFNSVERRLRGQKRSEIHMHLNEKMREKFNVEEWKSVEEKRAALKFSLVFSIQCLVQNEFNL